MTSVGSLWQSVWTATLNVRLPSAARVRGTCSSGRGEWRWISDTAVDTPAQIYERILYVSAAILNSVLWETGSR